MARRILSQKTNDFVKSIVLYFFCDRCQLSAPRSMIVSRTGAPDYDNIVLMRGRDRVLIKFLNIGYN